MNKTQKGCCIAGGVLLLIGIILLGLISCSKIDWFLGMFPCGLGIILGCVLFLSALNIEMEKRDREIILEQKEEKILPLRKKSLLGEESIKVFFLWLCIWFFISTPFGSAGEEIVRNINVCGFLVSVVVLVLATCRNIRHNWLIKNGKVILATIDRSKTRIGTQIVYVRCEYYDREQSKLWGFKGIYTTFRFFFGDIRNFEAEGVIPVLVSPKNYGNYFVLIKDVMGSYRLGVNAPIHFRRCIRRVNLNELEGGSAVRSETIFR